MRTRSRRRLDVFLLGAGAAATGAVALIGGVVGDTERVTGMWVGASLSEDSAAEVTEIIDYDFGIATDKHGIFRTIPGLTTDAPVQVSSASAPAAIAQRSRTFTADGPGLKLRIGDANTTISGRHRYRIQYPHPDVLVGDDRLEWDAVGAEWTVAVQQSEIHVVAPWEFRGLGCSQGSRGSRGGCEIEQVEPGHLVVTTGRLDSGEGVTVVADRGPALDGTPELPAPPTSAPPDPGAGLALPVAVTAVAGLGGAATTSMLVRRRGRERVGTGGVADAAWAEGSTSSSEVLLDHSELAAMATTEFAPPEGLAAPMGGIILTEQVRPEHKVAWLIEAAISGAVDLVEEGKKTVRLTRLDGGAPHTQQPLDRMFGGRHEVRLGSYDPTFATGWNEVGEQLDHWRRSSGLWDSTADARKIGIQVLGGIAAVIGLAAVGFFGWLSSRYGAHWLPFLAGAAVVACGGVAAVVRGWELRVRTPQGSGLWLRVESFRRFLAGSEAHHAEEAAKRGMLREYTAWAVAVGEIDRWQRAVDASSAIPEQAGLGYVHVAPMLAASTVSASTAPSSSGSGGGGGSVGGGGGGGGGGSW